MNIIEKVREILQNFPKIADVCHEIHVDFTEPHPDSYGFSSMGDALLSEDIIGNQTRQHTFMLYTVYSGMNDYERMHNSSALLELSQWLHSQTGGEVVSFLHGQNCTGTITELRAENGMLYAVPQENCTDGVQYQLQIAATYTVEAPF